MEIDSDADPHLRWFNFAKNVSKHSNYRIKVGCVITKGNKPISVGFNKIKYNRLWSDKWKKTIHAEGSAIRTSGKEYIRNSTAYIYRETSEGIPAMARPCEDCMSRLIAFGIRRIYYSTDTYPYWGFEKIP